jgi:hypothetical protein
VLELVIAALFNGFLCILALFVESLMLHLHSTRLDELNEFNGITKPSDSYLRARASALIFSSSTVVQVSAMHDLIPPFHINRSLTSRGPDPLSE